MTPGLALLLMAQHPVAVASFFPAFLSFSNITYDISFRASKNVEGASKTLIYWPLGPVGIFFYVEPCDHPDDSGELGEQGSGEDNVIHPCCKKCFCTLMSALNICCLFFELKRIVPEKSLNMLYALL